MMGGGGGGNNNNETRKKNSCRFQLQEGMVGGSRGGLERKKC